MNSLLQSLTSAKRESRSGSESFCSEGSSTTETSSSSSSLDLARTGCDHSQSQMASSSAKAETTSHAADEEESAANANASYKTALLKKSKKSAPQTTAALPSVEDRKHFVGCLAAVLSVSDDYCYGDDAGEVVDQSPVADMSETSYENDDAEEESNEAFQKPATAENLETQTLRALSEQETTPSSKSKHTSAVMRHCSSSSSDSSKSVAETASKKDRYRQRRYDVMSDLLLSSSDLMQVDKRYVETVLLPRLASLLEPTRDDGFSRNPSGGSSDGSSSRNKDKKKAMYSAPVHSFGDDDFSVEEGKNASVSRRAQFLQSQYDCLGTPHIQDHLESMTRGSGLVCLALFLVQHLLSSGGYDARIRHAIKALAVLVIVHDMDVDDCDDNDRDVAMVATRKFESLEHGIAVRLVELSHLEQQQQQQENRKAMDANTTSNQGQATSVVKKRANGDELVRGLKIGGAAALAGTLFAVTGGLAAPGIAAGLAALASGTVAAGAASAAAAVLSSTVAATALFGVGGGSLAAFKMQRRTAGLTEFVFQREERGDSSTEDVDDAELHSTICFSGWLLDKHDYQRPWGVTPSNPPIESKLELLERFFAVYNPGRVPKCKKLLSSWRQEEAKLWGSLRDKYGRDPDHLFPLEDGPLFRDGLNNKDREILSQLFVELGHVSPHGFDALQAKDSRVCGRATNRIMRQRQAARKPCDQQRTTSTTTEDSNGSKESKDSSDSNNKSKDQAMPAHLATVWDYHAHYGGELYTVKWESALLKDLCNTVADLAKDFAGGGAQQILQYTALAGLISAIAMPYGLVSAANMVDSDWTLAAERSDAAGKALATSLLFSKAGHRPVTLVGYSFGARAIFSCLKELARYQECWEDFRESGKVSTGIDYGKLGGEKFFQRMREPASIVEDAIVCGMPKHFSQASWEACRQVVAGRFVNCFSQSDLILSVMFRYKRLAFKPVCGIAPINVKGVENIDVTDLVSRHHEYCLMMGDILKRVRHTLPFRSPQTSSLVVPEKLDEPSKPNGENKSNQ